MKTKNLKWISLVLLILFCDQLIAQTPTRTPKRRPAAGNSAYGNNAFGNNTTQKKDTTKPNNNANSAYGAFSTSGNNTAQNSISIDTTLPIEVIKSSSNGLLDSTKMSLRNDAAVDLSLIKDRAPLAYENIREDDAVYRVRVWREIDTREKINEPFHYAAVEDNGSQRFISILLQAIKDGDVTAFSGVDDRFTTPITADDALNAFGGGFDTSAKYDLQGNIAGYQVRPKAIDPDSIYKFRLKEEWVFDKKTSRMYVRILGIAPVIPFKLTTGEVIPNSDRAVWWIYYPDLRPVLAKHEAYNSKNYGARMTWEDLFESRMFSSYIVKSTIDNPNDLPLSSYVKDPLFRLLQGENIKDKIFNYEQALWSY